MWESEGRFREFLNYEKIKTYKDFGGIRNEEDYLITKNGARLLGKPKPMSIDEIEQLRLSK
jgi:Xaa-Pro aminopeptidase